MSLSPHALGPALYNCLNSLFVADPLIDELGLLLTAQPTRSDYGSAIASSGQVSSGSEQHDVADPDAAVAAAAFVSRDHKLGVAFWAVVPIYYHAQRLFLEARAQWLEIDSKSAGAASSGGPVMSLALATRILESTRAMLLVNADCYSAMHLRKQVIIAGHQSCSAELRQLNLMYTKHPKAGEAWAHRRWILARMQPDLLAVSALVSSSSSGHASSADRDALLAGEFAVCERVAEIYPKNYFAWAHRQWIVQRVLSPVFSIPSNIPVSTDAAVLANSSSVFFPKLVETWGELGAELRRLERWANRHVSDHSGFHQRQIVLSECVRFSAHTSLVNAPRTPSSTFCIPTPVADESLVATCPACALFDGECQYVLDLIRRYPGHESLWYHRRYLVLLRLEMIVQHSVALDHHARLFDGVQALFAAERALALEQATNVELERFEENRRYALAYNLWLAEKLHAVANAFAAQRTGVSRLVAEARSSNEAALRAMRPFWTLQRECWADKMAPLGAQ